MRALLIAAVCLAAAPLGCGGGEPTAGQLPPPPEKTEKPETAAAPAAKKEPKDPVADDAARAEKMTAVIEKLKPLAKKLGPPAPGDWLAQHKETGQSFQDYLLSRPVRPVGKRGTIYIQPLGEFTEKQRGIVKLTAEFMGLYFDTPVKILDDLSLDLIPAKARRVHPSWGMKQILTTYVLEDVLKPRLPKDAAASIAFTASDLWPGEGWNFVFGQASLEERVGVWSIYRNGDPEKSADEYRLCLLRTIKIATHETGHMFGMLHCTAYQCNMCGCNNRAEADRTPLALCPECVAKVCWAARCDPAERYKKLADFCKAQGLKDEEAAYRKLLEALEGKPQPAEKPEKSEKKDP